MTVEAPPIYERFALYDVDWDFYESLLQRLQDRHVFATYDHGTLELMSPSYHHDKTARRIFLLIHVIAEEHNLPICSGGSTTLRRKDKQVGLEPDECFYLKNAPVVCGQDEIDLTIDPPPDLAVEVEISRRLGSRQDLYAELGVPELWRYDGQRIRIFELAASGSYSERADSLGLPGLTTENINTLLDLGQTMLESEWTKAVRKWIKANPLGQ